MFFTLQKKESGNYTCDFAACSRDRMKVKYLVLIFIKRMFKDLLILLNFRISSNLGYNFDPFNKLKY